MPSNALISSAALKATIVAVLVAAVGFALYLKHPTAAVPQAPPTAEMPAAAVMIPTATSPTMTVAVLPRLVDLGADKCVPCKLMAPILEELKQEYAGRMEVDFLDVWKDPAAARTHNVQIIPTQIFYDAEGKELFRHEGFLSKDEILAKWNALGVNLEPDPPAANAYDTTH